MPNPTIPSADPSFAVEADGNFHDMVLQLAYRLGANDTMGVERLKKQVEQVYADCGGSSTALRATVEENAYGITNRQVAEELDATQAKQTVELIAAYAKEFAEYATMDLRPYVELEEGEEDLTSQQITERVMFAMVCASQYPLGSLARPSKPAVGQ